MAIDKKFVDQFIKVTSKAALASSYLVGKKDKIAADKAAVDTMRFELNKINMTGKVVIGEGTLDKAPMLYTGEILGTRQGPIFDIAVDPVEGTNFVANNLPGGITVLAIADKGNLFNAPETYMDKIATGKIDKGLIDLDFSLEKNIKNLSDFKNKDISNITACVMDRPRHKKIIDQ
ncbi:fructose-bisphosphatase class II, partial [Candidatus Pelagibacter sp.]|nr:fructose-bisphosphatase class II [Candidatus Pelagibacter sp.]